MTDDLLLIRRRREIPRPSPAPPGGGGSAAFVGVVATAAPAVGAYMLVNPAVATGAEVECGPGLLTVDRTRTVPVYLVGPAVPAEGDALVCRAVDYRWAAERMPGGGCSPRLRVPVVGCPGFASSCQTGTPHYLLGLADCTVTATKGSFSVSGTTSGQNDPFFGGNLGIDLDLSGGGAGTYAVTISRSRYETISTTFEVGCYTGMMPAQVMVPDADHTCCLISQGGDSTCAVAVPVTLHATTQAGAVTLTAVHTTSTGIDGCVTTFVAWKGTISAATYTTLVLDSYGNCASGSFTGDLDVALACPDRDGWLLTVTGQSCGFEPGVMSKIVLYESRADGCAEPIDLSFAGAPNSRAPFDTGSSTVTE